MTRAHVPCGRCQLCCSLPVALRPEEGDSLDQYEHSTVTRRGATLHLLKKKPSGECVYLTAAGCSIHWRAPRACQEFDCRDLPAADRDSGLMPAALFDRGKELLRS